jgi:2-oxoisovalerate dehydrogenase E2 component (dihydrolipoyl transacylase)
MPEFLLPDLGEGLSEAEVVSWHVAPGDRVTVDQVIAEVETAKAVVEIPVPYAGVVATLHAAPGAVVPVGAPLITVTADQPAAGLREPGVVVPDIVVPEQTRAAGNEIAEGADAATRGAAADGATRGAAGADGEEASGSVLIGYGTGAAAAPTRNRRGRRRGAAGAPQTSAPPARPVSPEVPRERIPVISPLVRKEARDAGLDLASLAGTGPGGVISRQDVRQAIAERVLRQQRLTAPDSTAPDSTAPDSRATATDAGPRADAGPRRIPLRGARKAAADKLSRSRREIPEATVWVDVNAAGLVETRRALNAADPSRPVSLLALLARFAILGLRRYPELNARIEGDEIVVPGHVHLGFAAQTGHGLVVPVVRDAHRLTTRDLSARLADRTAAARERRLTPADLSGGTFTVNNYGVFGVDGSAAIINHPEVAILGMGRVIDRPWVVDGELKVREVTELTLAFDHRACDGGTAGGFLRYVADCIESPATALGDM